MVTKRIQTLLPCLALAALLAGLSSCGWQPASSQPGAKNEPDRVQIAIHALDLQAGKPVVTLTNVALVRQLYATLLALSPLPQNLACTADFGPSYTLTFLQGEKTLTTANAQRYGCRRVSLAGEQQDRGATQEFWAQLDQAIFQATPVARPQQLAIQRTLQLDQPPQTAQITSIETVQRLYNAILALPSFPSNGACSPASLPEYQLVFHTPDQAIPSVLDETCHTISLEGNYQSRSGTFVMTDQFTRLFEQTLATASFAPARPDRLTLDVEPARGVARQITIADAGLRQQLYAKLFALPVGKAQPDCPPVEDKVAGKGQWYVLTFTQWGLPVLVDVDAYEGSCLFLSLDAGQGMAGGQVLQWDAAFWNLVHQAANS
ncbi:MAG TPA: hypothetical protein VGT44_05585 [Ktedonobacteraceae bacterium]|nr:hypothetical protein [Ktedonobacteraceae bacterium]